MGPWTGSGDVQVIPTRFGGVVRIAFFLRPTDPGVEPSVVVAALWSSNLFTVNEFPHRYVPPRFVVSLITVLVSIPWSIVELDIADMGRNYLL